MAGIWINVCSVLRTSDYLNGNLRRSDRGLDLNVDFTSDSQGRNTVNISSAGDQVTQYVYGMTLADSDIASSLLKRKEIYPDSVDEDDVIAFSYNRQQQVKEVTDQAGTVHAFDFDKLGRQIHDRVTTLGTGVDGAVRRISTEYEVRGMRSKVTSWNNASVTSGDVVNQCQYEYNNFGQLTTEWQSHSDSVNTSTTPKVDYGYANGSGNTIRPVTLTYPNGRVITSDYGAAGSMADALSRVASLIDDDDTHLTDYSYLGLGSFVVDDYTEPDLKWTLADLSGSNDPDTGDIYSGLDRFGRVKDNRWYDYGNSVDADRIKYGYDRASNRIWRNNTVAASLSKAFDELYSYDGIHRLKTTARGVFTTAHSQLTTATFGECWTLDATGNWNNYRQDDDGNGCWDLDQTRTANAVNEITNLSETAGPAWVTPAYSRAGNMTTIPKPADPTESFTATYDAWNRLVKLEEDNGSGGLWSVAEYAYDGAKRRVVVKTYTSGTLSETRHAYFTSNWQNIEERLGTSPSTAAPDRQFVWGLRYIDDLILRDRDTDNNGTLDERLYALQDANWNVTAIANPSATIQERYAYSAYGTPVFLNASFNPIGSSAFEWETLFCGYRWDCQPQQFYVRHRSYSSMVGTWLQRDPAGLSAMNATQYCFSRVTILVDPSGLDGIVGIPLPGPSTTVTFPTMPSGGSVTVTPIGPGTTTITGVPPAQLPAPTPSATGAPAGSSCIQVFGRWICGPGTIILLDPTPTGGDADGPTREENERRRKRCGCKTHPVYKAYQPCIPGANDRANAFCNSVTDIPRTAFTVANPSKVNNAGHCNGQPGWHYEIRFKGLLQTDPNSYAGSVICCDCCWEDVDGNAQRGQNCYFVNNKKHKPARDHWRNQHGLPPGV